MNPIRAALAETLEQSDFTSVQRRIQSLPQSSDGSLPRIDAVSRDCFLAPLTIDEQRDSLGACPHLAGHRCTDKGFLAIILGNYLQLLDWTARQQTTPGDCPCPSKPGYLVLRIWDVSVDTITSERASATCGYARIKTGRLFADIPKSATKLRRVEDQ